jgi:hypothetical protein
MPPEKPPREVKLTVPDEATQREVLQLWHQVVALDRQGRIPTIRAGAAVQPQDERSGLVRREVHRPWVRTSQRPGVPIEEPMIGERVTATFVDPPGDLFGTVRRVSGIVGRNDAGELVVKSDDGRETPVPRDANVDRMNRSRRR